MNLRVTLGFLVVAVVLGGLVFGLDKFNIGPTAGASATSTAVAGQDLQVFTFDDSKVSAFELHQGDKSVRIEKKEDVWTIAGSDDLANRTSFNSLLVRMSQLRATRRVDSSADLKQYGLDPVKESALVELSDGTKFELLIGGKTPVQTGTYAKKGDAPDVFVIADQFVSDFERLITDPKEPPTPTPRPATPTPDPALAITTPTPAP
jgi:hypothetical protein